MAAWRNKLISWKWSSFLLPVRGTATIGRLKDSKTDAKDAEQSVDPNTGYLKSLSNKNPRNLEYLAVAPKPKGFKTLKQRVDFYYRLDFVATDRHVYGTVYHHSGVQLVQVSTREFGIARHLYKTSDVCASYHVGRVVVARLKEVGLSTVMWEVDWRKKNNQKIVAFLKAITKGGIKLEEPRQKRSIPVASYQPPSEDVLSVEQAASKQ